MQVSERHPRAIVTGASRGLGRAFTEMLLAEGVEVWGTARKAENLFQHERLHRCSLDLADPASIAQFLRLMIAECPEVDLLVNNAGYGAFAPFEQFPVGDITRQLDVMLTGPVRLCRAFYPMMLKRRTGTLVNVASLAADFPLPMMPLYNASKAGLSNFSRTLELETAGTGVRVIDFQPGDYRTGFNQAIQGRPDSKDARSNRIWEMLEKHIEAAPAPEKAARDLRRALLRGKSGTVRSGGFFQARFAPFAARFASWGLLRGCIRRYYQIPRA